MSLLAIRCARASPKNPLMDGNRLLTASICGNVRGGNQPLPFDSAGLVQPLRKTLTPSNEWTQRSQHSLSHRSQSLHFEDFIASWSQGRAQPPFYFPQFTASVATAPEAWKMATHNKVLEKIVRLSSINSMEMLSRGEPSPPHSADCKYSAQKSLTQHQISCLASHLSGYEPSYTTH
jgi:hypothetical protein